MRSKKFLLHGAASSMLSIVACIIYREIYTKTLGVDYSAVLNIVGIIAASIFGCILMALAYFLLDRWAKHQWTGVLNILIAGLSLASVISPLSITLPLEIETPELFPGLAIPMHFFPALAFFALVPFFQSKEN